jgi:hypothetical protein
VRGEDERLGPVKQRAAMARRDSDASLRVERDDRGSVKCCVHMAVCATISYLLPLYGEFTSWSSVFFQRRQGLRVFFLYRKFTAAIGYFSVAYAM